VYIIIVVSDFGLSAKGMQTINVFVGPYKSKEDARKTLIENGWKEEFGRFCKQSFLAYIKPLSEEKMLKI
jgi:hypothetical protein